MVTNTAAFQGVLSQKRDQERHHGWDPGGAEREGEETWASIMKVIINGLLRKFQKMAFHFYKKIDKTAYFILDYICLMERHAQETKYHLLVYL